MEIKSLLNDKTPNIQMHVPYYTVYMNQGRALDSKYLLDGVSELPRSMVQTLTQYLSAAALHQWYDLLAGKGQQNLLLP